MSRFMPYEIAEIDANVGNQGRGRGRGRGRPNRRRGTQRRDNNSTRDERRNQRNSRNARNAAMRRAQQDDELDEIAQEIIGLETRGWSFTETANPRGQPVAMLKDCQKSWGSEFTDIKKHFCQTLLPILISVFGNHYFALLQFGSENDSLEDFFFLFAALLSYHHSGGALDVHVGGWHHAESVLREQVDVASLPQLYIPVTDSLITAEQKCVVQLNPLISDAYFRNQVSTITRTVQSLPNYIVKNLERVLYPNLTLTELARIENPETECNSAVFMKFLLETMKSCFKSNFICLNCAITLQDHSACIGHLASVHRNYIDLPEYIRLKALNTQLLLEQQEERHRQEVAAMQRRIDQLEETIRLAQP